MRLGWQRSLVAKFAAGALLLLNLGVAHRTGAEVSIVVRDANTRGPIAASVVLSGPQRVSDTSSVDGDVTFTDMPPGDYEVFVSKAHFAPAREWFHVDVNGAVSLEVFLPSASRPNEIAKVVVHASSTGDRLAVEKSSAIAILNPTLGDALTDIPGLVSRPDSTATSVISAGLEGHDPTQTALSLDGVPLNIPGTFFNAASLDPDLFDSFSVQYGAQNAALGGSVNFRTVAPTRVWQNSFEAGVGRFRRSYDTLTVQGTSGQVGIAYRHAFRATTSPLQGESFVDASGLTYAHAGQNISAGDALRLQLNTSQSNVMSLTYMRSTSYSDALCTVFINALPCGYGPGNYSRGQANLLSVADQFSLGGSEWTLTAYDLDTHVDGDFRHAVFDTVNIPAQTNARNSAVGLHLSGDVPLTDKDTLTITAGQSALSTDETASSMGYEQETGRSFRYTQASIEDRHRVNGRLSLKPSLQYAAMSADPSSLIGSFEVSMRMSPTETLALSAFGGRGVNPDATQVPLSLPGQLQYDCAAQIAIGQAPGASASNVFVMGARASYHRELGRGDVTASIYSEKDRNASLGALVSGSSLPASMFYDGYLNDVRAIYALPTVCGNATPPTAQSLYYNTSVPGVTLALAGAQAQAKFPVTHSIVFNAGLALTSAKASSQNPLLNDPLTVFGQGKQLQGVPFATGYGSLSFLPPNPKAMKAFVGVHYVGSGNPSFLPPYATVDAALVQPLRVGEVALLANNLFNSYAGNFATPNSATSFQRVDGSAIPAIAYPNPPRSIYASYTVALGHDAVAATSLAKGFSGASDSDDVVQPGTLMVRWALTKPADPFRRNVGSACTNDRSRAADLVLNPLRDAAQQLERIRSSTGSYPAAFALTLSPSAEVSVSYERINPQKYAFSLLVHRYSTFAGLLGCGLVHMGSVQNAESAGLPHPAAYWLAAAPFYYSPDAGFYFIGVPGHQGEAQEFRLYQLPKSAPAAPFALASRGCEAELKPIASDLLSQLSQYFASGDPASGSTRNWTIVRHVGSRGVWYELQSDELASVTSLVNCGHVSLATAAVLQQLGLGGVERPSFNYSASLGLYLIDPKK